MRLIPNRLLLARRRARRALLLRVWGRRLPVRSWTVAKRVRGRVSFLSARFGAAKGARFMNLPHRHRQGFVLRALLRQAWAANSCFVFFVVKSAVSYRRLKESLELAALSLPLRFASLARRWLASSPAAGVVGFQGALLALRTASVEESLRVAAWLDHPSAVCAGLGVWGRLFTLGGVCSALSGLPNAAVTLCAALPHAIVGSPMASLLHSPIASVLTLLCAWRRARAPARREDPLTEQCQL